ncbi:MAG: glycogen debranching protein GlgX, partial [Phycisphaerales bacterium]
PDIPEEIRGTYSGLAHPAAVQSLVDLGVTAIELMPVHQFAHDGPVLSRGLTNYWGYNSIAFFAPHNEYGADPTRPEDVVSEFKHLVKTLHAAGLEVIIDVVYNHTGEGNHMGPTLCLRGFDNQAYYRLDEENPMHYVDYTGCGNSLNMRHPRVLQLIMDSLRYWVTEMHVDGFRFDLASTLARELHDVDRLSAFFDLIQQDPVISQTKLIAEPWDVGEGGYQVGNFPPLWSEWNGKYRDCVRDFWRGEPSTLGEFASRFTGSADLYAVSGRRPYASINFVTAHDGFTLRDLVSYNEKHNEANGEKNRDGEDHNRSWNCGVEGETDDPEILELRARQQRNLLATMLLSQGIPMISHGDERGRTQNGNNNGYCQDNELTWIDWENFDEDLLAFTRGLIRLRRDHIVIKRRHWFAGQPVETSQLPDIVWFTHFGEQMTDDHWATEHAKTLSVFLNGHGVQAVDPVGRRIIDDDFLVLFSADTGPLEFTIPTLLETMRWARVVDTHDGFVNPAATRKDHEFQGGDQVHLEPRSVQVFQHITDSQ